MSNRRKIVWRNLAMRPTVYGVVAIGVSGKLAIENAGEYKTWNQLQREQVTTSATVLSDQLMMNSSGKPVGREITYEFIAPGSGNGSQRSSAEIQAQLQEKFFEGEANLSLDEESLSDPLPDGQEFVRGTQQIKPEDNRAVDTSGPIEVIYAASAPQNSVIANTDAGPSLAPTLLTLLFFSGGLWVLWQGVKRCFNPPTATPATVNQPSIEFSHRQR